tara:strand:- start:290 stop:1087 length:798 start_codon:yes stop_codon:yes gene_type:complete
MFAGKTVVITGASSGLGAALAEGVAKAGGALALLARDAERLRAVAESCRAAGARVVEVQGDVVDPGACESLISSALAEFSSIDYLVLNAGVSMWALFEEIEELSLFSKIMDTNYQGAVNCVHHGLAALKESGGLLVAISSIQGLTGVPSHTGYCASKHALQGFCDSLRIELKGTGVDVLTVLPSWVSGTGLRSRALGTEGEAIGSEAKGHRSSAVPLDRLVAKVLRAMRKRRRLLYVPGYMRIIPLLKALCPCFLDWIIKKKVSR